MKKTDATVAILTFNGEEYLDDLLKAASSQNTKLEYEILVIDSGSTDQTLDIVARYPKVRLHKIPNTEFGHGKTRNLAVKLAKGEFVLFLTQDSVPASDKWLDYMIEPFSNSDVACVFGKQIPRPDCFATLKREIDAVFQSLSPDNNVVLHEPASKNTFFSDVNSAVRRSVVLTKVPFRDVNYAEDQGLGIDMLDNGYTKAYTPFGGAYHSHDYRLKKYFKRKIDEAIGLRESTGQTPVASLRELYIGSAKATLRDYAYIIRDKDYGLFRKVHDLFWAPFYNIAYRLSIRVAAKTVVGGKKHQKLSLEAQARAKTKN